LTSLRNHRKQQLRYVAADLISALLVWLSFLLFRWLVYEGRLFSTQDVLIPAFNFARPLILYPIFCLCIYYLSGYYMRPLRKTPGKELVTTLASAICIAIVAFFVIIVDDQVSSYKSYYHSLLVLITLQFVYSYIGRLIVSICTGAHHHNLKTFTLEGETLRQTLAGQPLVLPKGTEHVVIEMPEGSSEQDLYRVINKVYPYKVGISFTAKLYDMLVGSARLSSFEGKPEVVITEMPMGDSAMCIKRAFDVVASVCGLILLSPVYLIIALLIKLDSHGPILYHQERIGHYGKPFYILKFRTMLPDAEQGTPQLSADHDPRITRIGKILRKYRLDELPQLWNILRGDMSIVGPRPEREYFINQIIEQAPYYCLIYKIRPGLTSWGPIRVGYTDTLEKMIMRLNYDIMYTENMSLEMDARIMLKTIRVILDGKGK